MKKSYSTINGEVYNINCIHYEPDCGEADAVIIALHGFGGDKESSAVRLLAESAVERGAAVVGFDFPCHGSSEVGESFFTVKNCIRDTMDVYKYAGKRYFPDCDGEGSIHFFATSFGAFVLANVLGMIEFKGARIVFRSPAVNMWETFLDPIAKSTVAELAGGKICECGFERKMYLGYDFWRELCEYGVDDVFFDNETLMIYGDRDDVVSPSHMREYGELRDNIRMKIIEGADHRYKGEGQLKEAVDAAIEFIFAQSAHIPSVV